MACSSWSFAIMMPQVDLDDTSALPVPLDLPVFYRRLFALQSSAFVVTKDPNTIIRARCPVPRAME